MDPPIFNDVDEALNEEQLINIQIDAHSVKEVLSELSVRLETANQQITILQEKKEINDINERMDKLQEQIENVASQSSRRINNAPQSMEEVTEEINKCLLPLKECFQKMLDNLHNLIKDENSKLLEDKLQNLKSETIELLKKEYASMSQHNSLLAHIQTIYDKISDLSKQIIEAQTTAKEIVITNQEQTNTNTIPDEFKEQLKTIQEKIDSLTEKGNEAEKSHAKFQKEFSEIKIKINEQDEEIKEVKSTLFLLGQKFNQYQNELEGRLNVIELSNLNTNSSNHDENEQKQENDPNQSNFISKIIPILTNLQDKQHQLELKVQEQDNLIQTLQANQSKPQSSKPIVTFAISETNSHQIIQNTENEPNSPSSNKRDKSETPIVKSSSELNVRPFENETIESQRSPSQALSLQSTPRDHQSFKELSRHLNENDLRVTDLENEVILIKATIKEIQNNSNEQIIPNPETVAEMKLVIDQKHAEQAQLVLSALSSSPQSKHQTARSQIIEQNIHSDDTELSANDTNSIMNPNNMTKDNFIYDFTINDIGNLSRHVQSLLIRVGNLENRSPTRYITPNDEQLIGDDGNKSAKSYSSRSIITNPNSNNISPSESKSQTESLQELPKAQKHVRFASTSVQTFEDTECQVVFTSDTATSPSTKSPVQAETETQTQIDSNQSEDDYQSILNVNSNSNENNLDSSKIESEPESNENRPKKVELRISTPVNEDVAATRTPNAQTPSSDRDKSNSNAHVFNEHYIELINSISDSLNDNIQRVSTLTETMKYIDNKVDNFISSINQLKFDVDNLIQNKSTFNEEEFTTNIIKQIRFEVDQRLMGLTPQVVQDLNNFAPIGVVKMIAQNFQVSVDGIEKQIGQIKDFLNSLVTRNDLDAMMEKINTNNQAVSATGDTAGGTFKMRCLLCGREASGVTGMITESEVAKLLGTPPNGFSLGKKNLARNSFDSNNANKLVLSYGKDAFRQKNKQKIKIATLPPMEEQPQNPLAKTTNAV